MTISVKIKLLGSPVFLQQGEVLAATSRKALWMAAYVLLTNTTQPRTHLANLFWGSADIARSLGSLRVALTKLPHPVLACLNVTREAIGVSPDKTCHLDVHEFVAGCQLKNTAGLQSAIDLYSGCFFEGIDEQEAPEFSDWVVAERNRLMQLAHNAHLALAQHQRSQGQNAKAFDVANLWLQHQPADEAMHRLLMNWLAVDVSHDRALAQYDVYRRALAVSQGAAPTALMAALAERLRQGISKPRNLPARLMPATLFFGRDDELMALRELLVNPACRLLTLHGMGGVGKTRLALALAQTEATRFDDGVFVVALDEIAAPNQFIQAVARACGLQPAGSAQPLDLLINFFRHRHALLVLDNVEHLISAHLQQPQADPKSDISTQLAALLSGTGARLKVLVTSREPFGLQEEWRYPVKGLHYPRVADSGDAQSYAAYRLFCQRAQQADTAFSPTNNETEVVNICALLEGLPLGLELAASWVGTMSMTDLLVGLRTQLASIHNRHTNRVERHRSLGAVVAFSWDRLTDELRQILSGLAILVGTFSSDAAAAIASATPAALSALADRSLLVHTADDRWHLHEVVRQFSWEQSATAPALRNTIQNRRNDYFMSWLSGLHVRLNGPDEIAAIAEIDQESANLREAWQSSAKVGNLAALEVTAPVWFDYLECRSFIAEGIVTATEWVDATQAEPDKTRKAHALYFLGLHQRFGARTAEALATLDEAILLLPTWSISPASATPIIVSVHAARAFTLLLTGQLAEAESEARIALQLAEQRQQPMLLASAYRVLGLAILQLGRRDEGRELQKRALALALSFGRPSLIAAAHNNLAMAENHLGNYTAAEAGYNSALACWRELQATANIGRALHNLGVVARRRGDYALALTRYQKALEVLYQAGDRNLIALNLMSTGDIFVRLGKPADACEPAQMALDMAEHDGHMLPALDARLVLAAATTALGAHDDAVRHLRIVLDAAEQHHFVNVLADAILGTAQLTAGKPSALGPTTQPETLLNAINWASEIARSDEVSVSIRSDAIALLRRLESSIVDSRPADLGLAGAKSGRVRTPVMLVTEARAALNNFAG